jgi:putative ABC transport system permease protein
MEAEPEAPLTRVQTVDSLVAASLLRQRVSMSLIAAFAGLAGALLLVGVYGVLSYSIGRRTREFGIRTAIGARPRDIIRLVFTEGLYTTAAGLTGGILMFFAVSRLFRALVYRVAPTDAAVLFRAALLIVPTSLVAMALPAYRAAMANPNSVVKDG